MWHIHVLGTIQQIVWKEINLGGCVWGGVWGGGGGVCGGGWMCVCVCVCVCVCGGGGTRYSRKR